MRQALLSSELGWRRVSYCVASLGVRTLSAVTDVKVDAQATLQGDVNKGLRVTCIVLLQQFLPTLRVPPVESQC
jgi:hypothetical protein